MDRILLSGARQQHSRKRRAIKPLCPTDLARTVVNSGSEYLGGRGVVSRRQPTRGALGWFVLGEEDSPDYVDPEFEAEFKLLVNQWRRETGILSSATKLILHRAYQQIIGKGPRAVPYILRELRDRPAPWFWALRAITSEDPAAGVQDFDTAVTAWLAWGRRQGLI
jgi:hypothetical protein